MCAEVDEITDEIIDLMVLRITPLNIMVDDCLECLLETQLLLIQTQLVP